MGNENMVTGESLMFIESINVKIDKLRNTLDPLIVDNNVGIGSTPKQVKSKIVDALSYIDARLDTLLSSINI